MRFKSWKDVVKMLVLFWGIEISIWVVVLTIVFSRYGTGV